MLCHFNLAAFEKNELIQFSFRLMKELFLFFFLAGATNVYGTEIPGQNLIKFTQWIVRFNLKRV